jgi:aromatic-L-amino-acid decarboxylase
MDVDEFRSLGHRLVDRLGEHFKAAADAPVLPDVEPGEVEARFTEPLPSKAGSAESVLEKLESDFFPFLTQLSSPGYLGLITASPLPIGALGDLVASAVNQNIGVWTLGPSATAMERQVIRWLCEMVGFGPGCDGNLTSGGMSANLTGLKLARDFATGNEAQRVGVQGRWAVYVSEERHISIDKSVDLVGLGRDALRLIPVDDDFSIRIDKLEEAIAEDRARGVRPACLVGLAGTTNNGAVDDLRALRRIADREGIWLHADAAYGGGMLLSKRWPGILDGLELADSVVIDPHKWLFAPIDCGAVLVKDAKALTRSFGLKPAYLTDEFDPAQERFNFFERSLDQSRRLRALKVWMIFRRYGADQLGAWIDANVEAVQGLHELVRERLHFRSACFPKMSAMCIRFEPLGVDEEQLASIHAEVARAVEKDGRFWIGTTKLRGKAYFRLCAVNLYTRLEHLAELLDLLDRECHARN